MIKKLILLKYWIFNLFNFAKPELYEIEYVDFILNNKPTFLVSWRTRNAFYIHISKLNFYSFEKSASAYIFVPNGVDELEIKISNSWRSQVKTIKLLRLLKINQMEFNLQPNFDEFKKKFTSIPNIDVPRIPTKVKISKSSIVKITTPKIINLIK